MPTLPAELQDSRITRITGQDEALAADVINRRGLQRLAVTQDSSYWEVDVPAGLVPGYTAILKFGYNPYLKNSDYGDIWDGGDRYVWPTSAAVVEVSSTSTSDSSAGIGARTVRLYGLDASYNQIEETVTLNGTTPVNTTQSFIRLHRMAVLTAGSTGWNIGNILSKQGSNLIAQISVDLLGSMDEGLNQSLMCIYTVPAGKTFFMENWYYSLRSGKSTAVRLFVRPFGGVFQIKSFLDLDSSGVRDFEYALVVQEKSDIIVSAIASTGSHALASGFDGVLVDNDQL